MVELLKPKKEQIKRITFHEITKSAIEESLKHPRAIDQNRVSAQQARRILDRLVGYELSPFLWKKVARGLSAGRVQSVTVRLIVEREREIKQFEAIEYWTIDAIFNKEGVESATSLDPKALPEGFFSAKLHAINSGTLDKFEIKDTKHAKELEADLQGAAFEITRVEKKESKKNPSAPFTTSTLQQEANRKLNFSSKQTMRIAQQLYEEGHITYMRTDSVNLSQKFLADAKEYLTKNFGKEYALKEPRSFKTKSKTAQEAHEAIRPTEASNDPSFLKTSLEGQQFKLYDLIWRRALGSQMPEAVMDNTSVDITAKTDAEYTFRATGQIIGFDGFLKIYPASQREDLLPELSKGEKVNCAQHAANQHFTEPPARYSDA
ncbi:MAG: type I DNA topoisomerase, partial [Patescibacteria group bacterium]|nr:type I DNA topoisomerase [Patescibacteria group bacterium]